MSSDMPDRHLNAESLTLGATVRARRRSLDLTQQDLADMADVGLRLVHEVEHDKDTIRLANRIRLLNALGLHLELASSTGARVGTKSQPGRRVPRQP